MDETEGPCPAPPSFPPSSTPSDPSLADLLDQLDKKALLEMEDVISNLKSSHQTRPLDLEVLKKGVQAIVSLVKTCLILRVVPTLFSPFLEVSLSTEELLQKLRSVAESIQTLYREQLAQTIDTKAEKIFETIQAKEKLIREQISKKQKQIAKLAQDKVKQTQRLNK